jgi:hypothetical protein
MGKKVNIGLIFEPLSIRTDKPDKVFEAHRKHISKKTVEAILHCIKYNKPKILFAEIIVPSSKQVITLYVNEDNFLENLEKNLEILVEYEEYELCAEIVTAKEKVLNGLPKKRSQKKTSSKEDIDNLINTIKNL